MTRPRRSVPMLLLDSIVVGFAVTAALVAVVAVVTR